MNTPEQIITEAVDKVCPERLELKFGCRFIDLESTQTFIYMFEEKSGAVCAFSETLGNDFYSDDFKFENETKIKILGSPITLAMILRTYIAQMKLGSWEDPMPYRYGGTTDSEYELQMKEAKAFKEKDTILEIVHHWNLTHDTLSAQSPQCKQFLADLLGK